MPGKIGCPRGGGRSGSRASRRAPGDARRGRCRRRRGVLRGSRVLRRPCSTYQWTGRRTSAFAPASVEGGADGETSPKPVGQVYSADRPAGGSAKSAKLQGHARSPTPHRIHASTSLLWLHPILLRPLVYADRGGAALWPESTCSWLSIMASALGADGLEPRRPPLLRRRRGRASRTRHSSGHELNALGRRSRLRTAAELAGIHVGDQFGRARTATAFAPR